MTYIESAVRSRQAVAAARSVLMRDGVARTSMRAVAGEAQIPLGTLQYVFPSKLGLLRAVIEDVVDEIAGLLSRSAELDDGLEHALGDGLRTFWSQLVAEHRELQLVQLELVTNALRTPGLDELPRWQYERYTEAVAQWCREAADRAREVSAVPYEQLARVLIAGIDGLILQHVIDPDPARSAADLDALTAMLLGLAAVRPAR